MYAGLLVSLQRDLTEPLAYALVAVAVSCSISVVAYDVFLWSWLGIIGTESGPGPIPFLGLYLSDWSLARQGPEIVGIILPAVICAALIVRAFSRGIRRVEVIALLANVAALALFLPYTAWQAYTTAGRVSVGVVVAAIYCLPYLPVLKLKTQLWSMVAATSWMVTFPAALIYGFATNLKV